MIQIKFIRQGSNSMLGGFSSGDIARVSEAMAAHLVNEAMVAEYVNHVAVAPQEAAADVASALEKPRRARRHKGA